MKEAHNLAKSMKDIEDAKHFVPGKYCVAAVNFDKIMSE